MNALLMNTTVTQTLCWTKGDGHQRVHTDGVILFTCSQKSDKIGSDRCQKNAYLRLRILAVKGNEGILLECSNNNIKY